MKRTATALLVALSLSGCGILGSSPRAEYVADDRETMETVGAEWAEYVEADPRLDSSQKERRARLLRSWEARVEAAEGNPDD